MLAPSTLSRAPMPIATRRPAICSRALVVIIFLAVTVPAYPQTFSVLYKFPNRTAGSTPSALLEFNGIFLGTTVGGASQQGNIFKLTNSGSESTIFNFPAHGVGGNSPT